MKRSVMKKLFILLPAALLLSTATSCFDHMDDLAMETGLTDGLVAYWPADRIDGTSVRDLSEKSNHLTISGNITSDSGKYGNGLYFNGGSASSTYSDFPGASNQFSIAMWIRSGSSYADGNAILSSLGVRITYHSPDIGCAISDDFAGGSGNIAWVSEIMPEAQWFYLSVTYDGSNLRLYINGELKQIINYSIDVGDSAPMISSPYSETSPFNGYLDEIRIYNRALSREEIDTLMDTGRE